MTVWRFFKSYLSLLKYPLICATAIIITADIFGRSSTYFGSRLIELISIDWADRYTVLNRAVLLIALSVGLFVGRIVFINFQNLVDSHYIPYIIGKMERQLFKTIHAHSPHYFEQEMSGNVVSKVNNVIKQFEHLYFYTLWALYQPFLSVLTVIVSICFVSFSIALILVVVMILFYALMLYTARQVVPLNRNCAQLASLATGAVVDSVSNAEIVKSFGRIGHEKKQLFSYLIPTVHAEKKRILKMSLIYMRQGLARIFIQTLFAAIPVVYWYYGWLSFADYIFIQGLVLTMTYQTSSVLHDLTNVMGQYAVMQEALDVLYHPLELTDKKNASTLQVSAAQIQIDNITFGYTPERPVFENFSLCIHGGEKIGLVGYSGSGKSSLIKLICRYYDVNKGAVRIDGQNIADVTQESLRQHISYIMQEPALLNRTVLENIRYARPNATDEEVYEAAKKACCHDFILKLPKGYHSKVGERGVMLSGGERQRIAIARAILKDAPILILDEATSALDSESEVLIQKALATLMADKTVIAIAHRLSTLQKMDRIIVLENGQITENGTSDELIENQKLYYQFYQMQRHLFHDEEASFAE